MPTPPEPAAPAAWIVTPAGTPTFEVWGLRPVERLQRSLERAGCIAARVLGDADAPQTPATGSVVVARSDWIYHERLVEALVGAEDVVLLVAPEDRVPVAARVSAERAASTLAALRTGRGDLDLPTRVPVELAPSYTAKLRKTEPPYLVAARPETLHEIEALTFAASYKGATDLVTKWVLPRPARAVTRRLAASHVHPNTVTLASWVLAIAAFALFWSGSFGPGLIAAWGMTFLDTVDGKLARVTLTSSRLGDFLDHGLDLVHPPFWWWAWGAGIGWAWHPETLVVVAGYFVGRLIEGVFLATFGFETHSWRPIDTLFRTITARRNPNLILFSVGTAAGRPDLGMTLVALWTAASLAFHTLRLLQAFAARLRGENVTPWNRDLAGKAAG